MSDEQFLQEHYKRYRDEGGDHAMYVVANDPLDKIAKELRRNYELTHSPVPEKKIKKFSKRLKKETDKAQFRDDLGWLTGTGRYDQ